MTADRPTALTVTLPLVWDGDDLCIVIGNGENFQGFVDPERGFWGGYTFDEDGMRVLVGTFPTRDAAERAVERAVTEKLGGVG